MKCKTCEAYIEPNPKGRKRLYCSKLCQPYGYKSKGAGLANCQVCGKDLTEVGTKGRPKRNCSNKCRIAARSASLKEKRQKVHDCVYCQKLFVTSRKHQRFCSEECRKLQQSIEVKEKTAKRYAELYPGGIKLKVCRWCDEPMEVSAKRSYAGRLYHPSCSKEAESARYRIKTVKRQKNTNPYRISHEQVVREYGDNCHICQKTIDLELARTHRYGLTVDHVIPVSKGGTDDMSNLRPAHWICNIIKSDKMPEGNNG